MSQINNTADAVVKSLNQRTDPTDQLNKTLDQSDFLKLLTTQLANQDPMNPQESSEFMGQMAQFSTVDGIQTLNSQVSSLSESLQSTQALQASSLVGRKVFVEGNQGLYKSGEALVGAVQLPVSASEVEVHIKNQQGEIIKRIPVGNQSAGEHQVQWNGLNEEGNAVPSGLYRIEAYGKVNAKTERFGTLVAANVESVTIDKTKGFVLNLEQQGAVSMNQIRQLGKQG